MESRATAALFLCPEGGVAFVSGERGFPAGAQVQTQMYVEGFNLLWDVNSDPKLVDIMRKARDFLKTQYDSHKGDIDGLLNAVFENMKVTTKG